MMVGARGKSETSMNAQHVQNTYHAMQIMLKPDSPCCLSVHLKSQHGSMLVITGCLWVPGCPTGAAQSKLVNGEWLYRDCNEEYHSNKT